MVMSINESAAFNVVATFDGFFNFTRNKFNRIGDRPESFLSARYNEEACLFILAPASVDARAPKTDMLLLFHQIHPIGFYKNVWINIDRNLTTEFVALHDYNLVQREWARVAGSNKRPAGMSVAGCAQASLSKQIATRPSTK